MSERLFVRLHEDATQGPESEAPAGTLRTLAFDPSLRPHVTHVLAYREDIAAGCDVVERVLPDGALRLVFNLGASVSSDQTPAAILIGAHTSPVTLRLRGAIDGLHGMLRVLRRQAARPAWAALAADGGYYDQAHLANEFRVLCGVTPAEFMRRTISPSSKTAA